MGLAGEKPIIPAPPKVWPLRPVPVLLVLEELLLVSVLPVAPDVALVPLGLVVLVLGVLVLLEPRMELPLGEEPKLLDEEPKPLPDEVPKLLDDEPKPLPEEPPTPFPPLGPVPASVEPAIGCPKKPIAVGVLFCPKRTGFQSSLPVVGSIYRLRRKRISLVFTSASMFGG